MNPEASPPHLGNPAEVAVQTERNESQVEFDCRRLTLSFRGPAALVATSGLVAIGAYVVYRVVNHPGFVDSVIDSVQTISGTFVESMATGSVVVQVVAETEAANQQIFNEIASGELLLRLNKEIRKYSAEYRDEIGEFETAEITSLKTLKTNHQQIATLKIKAEKEIRKLKTKGILMTSDKKDKKHKKRKTVHQWTSTVFFVKTTMHQLETQETYSSDSPKPKRLKFPEKEIDLFRRPSASSEAEDDDAQFQHKLALTDVFIATDPNTFQEAYGVLNQIYRLGPKLQQSNFLLGYYKVLMSLRRFDEAHEVKAKIESIIQNDTRTTADDLSQFAEKLEEEARPMEAILFYEMAAKTYQSDNIASRASDGLQQCCEGFGTAANSLIEADFNHRAYIVDKIIPLMNSMAKLVEKMENPDEQTKVTNTAWCWKHIGELQQDVGDIIESEATLTEALEFAEKKLSKLEEAYVYGMILECLGSTYMELSKFEQAVQKFQQAIKVYGATKDFEAENDRIEAINDCMESLVQCQKYVDNK